MRRIVIALLVIMLLSTSLPVPAYTAPSYYVPDRCPLSFTPAHNATVRVLLPLLVSLEWDTHGSTACDQWQAAMASASAFLESATNGQIALGPITIEDNAQDWTSADIQVHVQNTSVPDATVGGISPAVVDAVGGTPGPALLSPSATLSSGGVFTRGSIHVGRSWSEFGPRRGPWSDPDGYRTLVHELGHYAFYLYDEYFGYTGGTSPARIATSCTTPLFNPSIAVDNPLPQQPGGSLMYWEYALQQFWNGTLFSGCLNSRQWQVYGEPDWTIIAQHYAVLIPAVISAAAPAQPPCPACTAAPAYHWLFNFAPLVKRAKACGATTARDTQDGTSAPCLLADGFLVKSKDTAVLHEGVPYLPVPPIYHTIPGAPGFYPPYVLEMLGANRGDVARITLTDPANPTRVTQVALRLNGPAGATAPVPHLPAWYATPLGAVPQISVQPIVTTSITGSTTISGLRVTAINPLGVPFQVAGEHGTISATLFESGQGRQASGVLTLSSSPAGGHETYTGFIPFTPGNPILEGSFYLTPTLEEARHEDPDIAGGGAWAMASYSLSCNSPTYFLNDYAPGDEGGIDSSDGVINVHLPANADMPDLCVGITSQTATPPPGGLNLGPAYAIQGSSPLPAGTLITFHFDQDTLPGTATPPVLVRRVPPAKRSAANGTATACRVVSGATVDMANGTFSAAIASTAGSSAGVSFQLALLSPASLNRLPPCPPGTPIR